MNYYSKPRQVLQVPLDKLLFALASLYLGLTVAWLVTHQNKQQVSIAPSKAVAANTNSPSHEESIAHLEKSLETVDRQAATVKTAQPSSVPTSVSPVLKVAPPPPPPIPNPSVPPVERIYIPVYPNNPSFTPAKPKKVTSSPLPPPPPVVTVAPSAIPSQPLQIDSTGKLVGLLELGDRSSALFDVSGSTKRIAIGDNVNGWVLIKVQNQQVFLSRGSTTRVLDLGQSL